MSKEQDSTAQLAAALEKLAAAQAASTQTDLIAQILEDNRKALAAADERRRLEEEAERGINFPEISDLNPLGERKHPRPDLKARQTLQCGMKLEKEALSRAEIELINRLADDPGERLVTKADGTRIRFTVSTQFADSGSLERLEFSYPCKNEHRNNHAPLVAYIREYLGEPDERTQLLQKVAALQDELRKATQPVGA